jgi:hypothetical protein
MLPRGETFDRFFFVDIVLDSLEKKFTQIPDLNPEKGHFCIWTMPNPIWSIVKFKEITSPGGPIQLTAQISPRQASGLWVSEKYVGREFI